MPDLALSHSASVPVVRQKRPCTSTAAGSAPRRSKFLIQPSCPLYQIPTTRRNEDEGVTEGQKEEKRWESLGLSWQKTTQPQQVSCPPQSAHSRTHTMAGRHIYREAAKCSGVIPSKFLLLMLALEARRLSSTVTCVSRFSSYVFTREWPFTGKWSRHCLLNAQSSHSKYTSASQCVGFATSCSNQMPYV